MWSKQWAAASASASGGQSHRARGGPPRGAWRPRTGGGVTDGHGEGKTGAGVHEGEAVLHSAVTGREGNSFDQPSGREKKTLRGSSGDELERGYIHLC